MWSTLMCGIDQGTCPKQCSYLTAYHEYDCIYSCQRPATMICPLGQYWNQTRCGCSCPNHLQKSCLHQFHEVNCSCGPHHLPTMSLPLPTLQPPPDHTQDHSGSFNKPDDCIPLVVMTLSIALSMATRPLALGAGWFASSN